MSDLKPTRTPRTLLLAAKLVSDAVDGQETRACGLMYDHARTLERELSAALARVEGLEGALRRCDHNPLGEWCCCMLRNRNEPPSSHSDLCRDVRALLAQKEGGRDGT